MNESIKTQIGKELKKLRIDNNVSVEEIASKTKIDRMTIYRYEKGIGTDLTILSSILSIYGIGFDIFFKSVYDNMHNSI